jgi:hypothetical protein
MAKKPTKKGVYKAVTGGMMPAQANKGGAMRGLDRAAAMSGGMSTQGMARRPAFSKGGKVTGKVTGKKR